MAKASEHRLGMTMFSLTMDGGPVTVAGIIARLRGLIGKPVAPETFEQAADRREAARREAGAELQRLEAERDVELPRLAAAEARARSRLEAMVPGYRQAIAELEQAEGAHIRRAHDFQYAREVATRRIVVAADPVIDEFQDDLLRLLEANRATPIGAELRDLVFHRYESRYVGDGWSNLPSIEARRVAILAARDQAEELKADPDQSDIRQRLEALIADLPDPTVLVKVTEPDFSPPPRPLTAREAREELLGWKLPTEADGRRADAKRSAGRRL